ncbi:MAG: hypothetical protein ABF497_05370 [Sporolactobacillus sp.]
MVNKFLARPLTKEIEAVIMKLGKEYERFPSKEELGDELGISYRDADDYLKMFKKQMDKMR